jgi:hypothetical protein
MDTAFRLHRRKSAAKSRSRASDAAPLPLLARDAMRFSSAECSVSRRALRLSLSGT